MKLWKTTCTELAVWLFTTGFTWQSKTWQLETSPYFCLPLKIRWCCFAWLHSWNLSRVNTDLNRKLSAYMHFKVLTMHSKGRWLQKRATLHQTQHNQAKKIVSQDSRKFDWRRPFFKDSNCYARFVFSSYFKSDPTSPTSARETANSSPEGEFFWLSRVLLEQIVPFTCKLYFSLKFTKT